MVTFVSIQILETDFGLEVEWDGDNSVDVYVNSSLADQVCGLCGNFNGDDSDDFTNPNGTLVSNILAIQSKNHTPSGL